MPLTDLTTCPACGSREHYRLKDERLQCAECRKKYTAVARRSRLSAETLQHVVRSFWRMVPVSASASELGLNVKTLQKYHDRLRRRISAAGENWSLQQLGTITVHADLFHRSARGRNLDPGALPLFCLVPNGDKVLLLQVEAGEGSFADMVIPETAGWIYAHDQNAKDSLDLDRIHYLSAGNASERGDQVGFWISAKRRLVKYRGGFRKNFHLFMREMEFRFNNDNEDSTCGFLLDFLQNDTTNRDRR